MKDQSILFPLTYDFWYLFSSMNFCRKIYKNNDTPKIAQGGGRQGCRIGLNTKHRSLLYYVDNRHNPGVYFIKVHFMIHNLMLTLFFKKVLNQQKPS